MPAERLATTSGKLTPAEIICRISTKFEKRPTEDTMVALVERYRTGDPKIDRVILGFARDTLLATERKQTRK